MLNKIFLTGFMACGKTTIAKILSEKLNFKFVDTDKEIEKLTQLKIPEIFSKKGEHFFREQETKILKKLKKEKNLVIATGGGFFLRNKNIKIAKKMGKIVFLKTNLKTCLKRSVNKKRPLLENKSQKELNFLFKQRLGRYFKTADFVVLNNKAPEHCIENILKLIF